MVKKRTVDPKVALDPALRDSLGKTCFRDVILSKESGGRAGLRQFLGFPGRTREQAARDVVRLFGVNRFPFLSTEFRAYRDGNKSRKLDEKALHELQTTPLRRYMPIHKNSTELMLIAPIHSVFGRPRTPVNFILDIDCRHESAAETADPTRFEDQMLGLCFSACRAAFQRYDIAPAKVAILTANGPDITGRPKPYSSLHLHMDLRGAAFGDSYSAGVFMRRELLTEIAAIGDRMGGHQQQQHVGRLADRLREAIDLAPFWSSMGGSLRLYGAPKTDLTRPLRLFRPVVGGACATALYAMGAPRGADGGPTMRLLFDAEQSASAATGGNSAASGSTTTSISSSSSTAFSIDDGATAEEQQDDDMDVATDPVRMDNALRKTKVMIGLRPIELEALALSFGIPDYMASTEPLRLLYLGEHRTSSSAASSVVGNSLLKSFTQPSSGPEISSSSVHSAGENNKELRQLVAHVQNAYATLPKRVLDQVDFRNHSPDQLPHPRHNADPETWAHCAAVVAPLIRAAHAKPYRSWVAVALALADIAVAVNPRGPAGGNNGGGRDRHVSSNSNSVGEDLSERLLDAFIRFSVRAPNYDHEACTKIWHKTLWRKTRPGARPTNTAREGYFSLVRWLKKSGSTVE